MLANSRLPSANRSHTPLMKNSMNNKIENAEATKPEESRAPDRQTLLQYTSEELFQGEPKILIGHNDSIYFLKITKAGKLILTK